MINVAFGDFNGDGKLDVVGAAAGASRYEPILYLGNGDGTFQDQIPFGTFLSSAAAVPVDINGDGALDVAVGDSPGNLDLLLQGTFTLTPNILFNPKNLAFGNVRVGHTATRSVTMTNSGTAPFTPTITFRGTGNSQFSQSSTCPATVYPRVTCVIRVAFTPTSTETLRVQLVATDNSTGDKQTLLINAAGSQ